MLKRSWVLLCVFLAGCAVMQAATPPAPKNPAQGVILATYEVAAMVNAASDSYEQGLISKQVLREVLDRAKEANMALTTAQGALGAGDLATAQGQLAATRTILTTLRGLLGGDQ